MSPDRVYRVPVLACAILASPLAAAQTTRGTTLEISSTPRFPIVDTTVNVRDDASINGIGLDQSTLLMFGGNISPRGVWTIGPGSEFFLGDGVVQSFFDGGGSFFQMDGGVLRSGFSEGNVFFSGGADLYYGTQAVFTGGVIEGPITATGSDLRIEGGEFRGQQRWLGSTSVTITGGVFRDHGWCCNDSNSTSSSAANVNISGGLFDSVLLLGEAPSIEGDDRIGVTQISGGVFEQPVFIAGVGEVTGGDFDSLLALNPQSGDLLVNGGMFSVSVGVGPGDGRVVISGGSFDGGLSVGGGSEVVMNVSQLSVDGVRVDLEKGISTVIQSPVDSMLSGRFADGSDFEFDFVDATAAGDFFSADATLTVKLVPEPGDYNGDTVIDVDDYDAWQASYSGIVSPFSGADGNGDGVINAADYTVWRDALAAAATPAPEPSAVGIGLIACFALVSRRH